MPPDRRIRKRLATRQGISDAATRLFIERGFDNVTVDEIAEVADVGRMTVFNHFPRKEDMFFDRDEEGRETLRDALRQRDKSVAPIEALRLLAHRAASEDPLYISFSPESQGFVETIEKSATLIARARAIRDELAQFVMVALAESVEREPTDPDAHLAANLLLATWTVAFIRAHRAYRESQDAEKAKSVFLALIDRGTSGLEAAMVGTPYAQASLQAAAQTRFQSKRVRGTARSRQPHT
ncbi:TetR/AcrR family transcriptional regulator [Bradyrhizobium canariense]|uniref:Transcriptional regulator, TetR family n=1 Tax=Bradyrhizobium canariense TaxID=255045 RepID=A0A1H2B5U2_9BRAD|nr:TetR/AcrR family transcriptional regulator [Bradyrhizobium canariense]SDT53309.1 transcriptional regulator, TetR family [Bradyrhizobium canariense]